MEKIDFSKAQAAFIERDDIVVRVAKMIDPSAFSVWYRNTEAGRQPIEPDTGKKYMQSRAIFLAASILKMAALEENLKQQLADSEVASWEAMGVPANDPDLRPLIDKKFGLNT